MPRGGFPIRPRGSSSESTDLVATRHVSRATHRRGGLSLKFVAGLSVASILAAGTWAAVSRPGAAPVETSDRGRIAPAAAAVPAAVLRAFALQIGRAHV